MSLNSVYGDAKLVLSVDNVESIENAFEKINDLNIVNATLHVITDDGRIHKIKVHDLIINWNSYFAA